MLSTNSLKNFSCFAGQVKLISHSKIKTRSYTSSSMCRNRLACLRTAGPICIVYSFIFVYSSLINFLGKKLEVLFSMAFFYELKTILQDES